MRRVAAIDCGTNSIRLLIADVAGGALHDLVREMRIVRLGEGVDRTGMLAPAAVQRTLQAVAEYAEMIEEYQVSATRFVGTSAMRDAGNGEEFIRAARDLIGVTPEVIPGAEEAQLSFRGAISSLSAPAPQMVVDIGGGSTEFVFGAGKAESALSLDMGSVRLTERFRLTPGLRENEEQARDFVATQLDQVENQINLADLGALVGVAGTVTTLAAKHCGVQSYSPEVTHGKFLTWQQWHSAARFMIDEAVATKAALPFMPPGRADVIGGGALIWSVIIDRVSQRCPDLAGAYVSEHDILDGIAASLA